MRRILLALAIVALAGCRGEPIAVVGEEAYLPPTLSLPQLVERVNANNARLPSLVAGGYFEAVLVEEPGGRPTPPINGTLNLLHLKPDRLRLAAKKDLAGNVFELGTDGERFWMHLPLEDLLFTGTFAGVDERAAATLPVRPDLILQVLGVNLLPTQLDDFPAPVLEYDPDGRTYMVRFVEPAVLGEPRLKVAKQVWYDAPRDLSRTPRPLKVILSDDDGRPVLAAYLSDHQRVGDGPDAPLVATQFALFFPETGSKMLLRLDELALTRDARFGPDLPNARSFRFDPDSYRGASVRSLDRAGDR